MIPAIQVASESACWKQILKHSQRSAQGLLERLALDGSSVDFDPTFAVRVPEPFIERMRIGDLKDPLLLQVLPQLVERDTVEGFTNDALNEMAAVRTPGVLQKYHGRALLMVASTCAVNCRYCFRRHFPYQAHGPATHTAALQALEADTSIEEVILSGGDPLIADDARIADILTRLDDIAHIKRIRIHSRLPIVIPQRITEGLLNILAGLQSQTVVVVHVNHAQELDGSTHAAFKQLKQANTTLLNQAVLLKHINDAVATQKDLAEALFEQGVLPYYLHMLDQVAGAHHFDVAEIDAQKLMAELHAQLPGYLVPRLVREIPEQSGKTPVFWTTQQQDLNTQSCDARWLRGV